MDKKSSVLITIFTLIVTCSIVITYYKYVILEEITYSTDEVAFQENLLDNQ